MTPAEKLAAVKPPRKNGPAKSVSRRNHPWKCTLREMRFKLRLTIQDVSLAIGLSGASLSEIERGTDPRLTTARQLAEFFGKSIEELWPSYADPEATP